MSELSPSYYKIDATVTDILQSLPHIMAGIDMEIHHCRPMVYSHSYLTGRVRLKSTLNHFVYLVCSWVT